jgi:SAM-dependent methyltransferase
MADRVCPWWVGYLLASPLRRLSQDPKKILAPYVRPGMVTLDAGCAMGFFSLDMARLVGAQGKVVCVDLQDRMIKSLVRRASKAGLLDRIDHRVCPRDGLGLEDYGEKIDFALAFAVVHEVPDAQRFLGQIHSVLKPDGVFLLAEPRGHVPQKKFDKTEIQAEGVGFDVVERPNVPRSRAALLKRKPGSPS